MHLHMVENALEVLVVQNQAEPFQKIHHTAEPARNPDIDIPRLPCQRIGVEPRVRLALEDNAPAAMFLEQVRNAGCLAVHLPVNATDRFSNARPLQHELL